jgi:seryl-tRNA synthetase
MPQLFELADEIERLMAEVIDHETGEITDEGLAKLDAIEMERDEKALAIAQYMMSTLAEAEMVAKQAQRLGARAKVLTNQAGRLKQKLTDWLPVGTKLRDDVVQIGWRKSTAVEVSNAGEIPDVLCNFTRTPDLTRIKMALKRDASNVPAAKLVTRHHVSIR